MKIMEFEENYSLKYSRVIDDEEGKQRFTGTQRRDDETIQHNSYGDKTTSRTLLS